MLKISELRSRNKDIAFEADEIICKTLGIDRAKLLLCKDTELTEDALCEIEEMLTRLRDGEPLQYILGSCWFYGREFFVDGRVLIPRFDTECVVEYALKNIKGGSVADICSGSGCIALTLLCEREDIRCSLFDISPDALEVSRINAQKLGVSDRASFNEFDVMSDECWDKFGTFDTLVSNPPYIPTGDIPSLSQNVLREPRIALDGGADGMDFYRKIIERSRSHFTHGVNIIFEIGYDEGEKMISLAKSEGLSCEIKKDINDRDRVALLA